MSVSKLKNIGGYIIHGEISRGAMGIIYRVEKDGKFAALKLLTLTDEENVQRFRAEAASIARLNHPNLVKIHDANDANGSPYIVMDLIEGLPLSDHIKKGPASREFFIKLANSLAGALTEIHKYGIVHRDIKPANIMITNDGDIKLIDLGLASSLTELNDDKGSTVVGTILYSSPEQSKILKRPVDARSDLNSLGITLFEALTGDVPFQSDDLGELIRMHASIRAPSVKEKAPETSNVLAAIIAKLIDKDPDDRYQSAEGLKSDLDQIEKLEAAEKANKPFPLGARDLFWGNRTELPLAGREAEFALLLDSWTKTNAGAGRALLIEGEGGSGKSRLTDEFLGQIHLDATPILLRAKCQNFSSRVPLGPIREAFDTWLRKIFALPEDEQKAWFERIQTAAVGISWSLNEVSTSFKKILGSAEGFSTLDSETDRQRFYDDIVRFLCLLTTQGNNLIFLIDDVQWLDPSSSLLLSKLSEQLRKNKALLLMTARNDSQSLPAVNKFKQSIAAALEAPIKLGPLSAEGIKAFVGSQLGSSSLPKDALDAIAKVTNGNPFVISETIRGLLSSGHLKYSGNQWKVDAAGIANIDLSKNVFDLILNRINNLSPTTLRILSFAAVEGNSFGLKNLAVAMGLNEDDLVFATQESTSSNLIAAVEGDKYRFTHDRIREALISRIEAEPLKEINDKFAIFLNSKPIEERPWFDIARHFAGGHIEDHYSEAKIANHEAAKLAIANFAYDMAFEFTTTALRYASHLPKDLVGLKVLAKDHAIASCESGNEEESFAAIDLALKLTDSEIEILDLLYLKIRSYFYFGRLNEAWVIFKQAAEKFKVPHPKYPLTKRLQISWLLVALIVRLASGLKFKGSSSPEKRRKVEVLSRIYYTAAYINRFRIDRLDYYLLTLRMLDFAYRQGNGSTLARAFIHAALVCCPFGLKKIQKYFADRAMALVDQQKDPSTYAYVRHFELLCRMQLGEPNWPQQVDEVCSLAMRYLGAHEAAAALATPGAYHMVYGRHSAGAISTIGNLPIISKGKTHYNHVNAYSQIQINLVPLGPNPEILQYRKQSQQLVDQVKDLPFPSAFLVSMLIITGHEQGEISNNIDLQIDFFKSFHYTEHVVKRIYVVIAEIRLKQLELATTEDEKKRARINLKQELHNLYMIAYLPVHRCHWFIIAAGLARLEGKFEKALELVNKGYQIAKESGSLGGLFAALRARAQIYFDLNDEIQGESEDWACYQLCLRNDWVLRAQAVQEEFDIVYDPILDAVPTSATTRVGQKTTMHSKAKTLMTKARETQMRTTQMRTTQRNSTRHAGKTTVTSNKQFITKEERAMAALMKVSLATLNSIDPKAQSEAVLSEIGRLLGAERGFIFLNQEYMLQQDTKVEKEMDESESENENVKSA